MSTRKDGCVCVYSETLQWYDDGNFIEIAKVLLVLVYSDKLVYYITYIIVFSV